MLITDLIKGETYGLGSDGIRDLSAEWRIVCDNTSPPLISGRKCMMMKLTRPLRSSDRSHNLRLHDCHVTQQRKLQGALTKLYLNHRDTTFAPFRLLVFEGVIQMPFV